MTYFPDLTPYAYTPPQEDDVLNVGWLDSSFQFEQGVTSHDFHEALRRLTDNPILLHRGFHVCQFCESNSEHAVTAGTGNGQIRVMGQDRKWYAAPTLVYHYVISHHYLPPQEFIEAVLSHLAIGHE